MNNSKSHPFTFLLLVLLLGSCSKKETYYTTEELQLKTDSIIRSKIAILEQAAKEDLNRRLPIELKVKLDSIFQVSYDIPPAPTLQAADGTDDTAGVRRSPGDGNASEATTEGS